jgi:glycosyltransferase involved in cell wall biosynthesis
VFEEQQACGAVGAKLLYPNGALQDAGGIVWRDGDGWTFGKHDDPARSEYNYLRRTDYCSSAALMVRRDAFTAAGGFDTEFAAGHWEAADLCFRLIGRGLGVWYQPASVVYRCEAATDPTSRPRGPDRSRSRSHERFRGRWAAAIAAQPPADPRQLFSARDRNRGPLVFVFDHRVPTPDRDAGSVFMDRLLAELVGRRYRVVFWPENLFPTPGYVERLQQRGIEVVYGPARIETYLRACGRRAAAAIAYRSEVAARCLPPAQAYCDALGCILCDMESLRETRRVMLDREPTGELEALRRREREVLALTDSVGVHSPVEKKMLEHLVPGVPVVSIPLPGAALAPDGTLFHERPDIVFVGSTHPPNVDALSHFIREIWPAVRRELGPVTLRVAGDVCHAVSRLSREPGVKLLGYVPDLGRCLSQARVFVSPLRYGAGIKGKVLAAMNAGVPLVTTPVGAEGIGLVHEQSALVAETDADFARQVVRLYRDPSLWNELRRNASALSADWHATDRFRDAVTDFLAVLERPVVTGAVRAPR